jgi:O-acetyl-ADP-ribose deacetylase (regulator of RNase III)
MTVLSRIELVRGDIVDQDVDVIVNAANQSLLGGGGVDGAIHDAAGPELLKACRPLGGCPTGSARITLGFRLKAKWVVHAVGPVWSARPRDEGLLRSAYKESMRLAARNGARSIAFPSISTGAFRYPVTDAAPIALGAVAEMLEGEASSVETVRFVLWDTETHAAYRKALKDLQIPGRQG